MARFPARYESNSDGSVRAGIRINGGEPPEYRNLDTNQKFLAIENLEDRDITFSVEFSLKNQPGEHTVYTIDILYEMDMLGQKIIGEDELYGWDRSFVCDIVVPKALFGAIHYAGDDEIANVPPPPPEPPKDTNVFMIDDDIKSMSIFDMAQEVMKLRATRNMEKVASRPPPKRPSRSIGVQCDVEIPVDRSRGGMD
ncbi:hypothetical protein ABW19_dt0210278 [Dactylella cylindrospora]|nr:hypothetical protein ABW19_dt0210278 [Dactylella cylindrospora]